MPLAVKYGFLYDWALLNRLQLMKKQTTTLIWNRRTVTGKREEWPDPVKLWFDVDSRDLMN